MVGLGHWLEWEVALVLQARQLRSRLIRKLRVPNLILLFKQGSKQAPSVQSS